MASEVQIDEATAEPAVGQTRCGTASPGMNDAYVHAHDPQVSPTCPWYVVWPKGNRLNSGSWYTTKDVMTFWPEVVKDRLPTPDEMADAACVRLGVSGLDVGELCRAWYARGAQADRDLIASKIEALRVAPVPDGLLTHEEFSDRVAALLAEVKR